MRATIDMWNQLSSVAQIAVLIPARRQEPSLVPLVDALLNTGFGAIILVDDGSPQEDKAVFDSLAKKNRVHLLHHAINLGKGRALKTGMNFFLHQLRELSGLVTADADGQHACEDILRVANAFLAASGHVVLGCRRFSGQVPLRSRLGNMLTRKVFYVVSRRRISDTQTGLRAFPAALLPNLIALHGERYEYEMNVLTYLCRHGYLPLETPISTIYTDGNRSSHFNPLLDSLRIFFILLRAWWLSLSMPR